MFEPKRYGSYLLLEKMSTGGMAEIFRAVSQRPDRTNRLCVIKRILPYISQQPGFEQMFIDEADIAGNLEHENIIRIYDLGKIDETIFMALEPVDGKDLRLIFDFVRSSGTPIPFGVSAFIASKIGRGLDYAHRYRDDQGRMLKIVHRDISPPNILVSFEGDVKLIDFGIAKATKKINRTKAGILKGKFGYMSPEQVQGMDIDGRSDVFALGIVLWEMLAHRRLFVGDSEYDTLQRIKKANVMIPSTFNSDVPPELDMIAMRALKRNVNQRYASAAMFSDALDEYLMQNLGGFGKEELATWMQEQFEAEKLESDEKREHALTLDMDSLFSGKHESTEEEITPHYKEALAASTREEPVLQRRDPREYEISEGIHDQDTQPISSSEGSFTYPLASDSQSTSLEIRSARKQEPAGEIQTARKPQPVAVAPSASNLQPVRDVQTARKPEPSVEIPKPEIHKTTGEIRSARKQEPAGEVQTARKPQPVAVTPSASKLQPAGDVQTTRKPEPSVEIPKPEPPKITGEIRSARKQEPAGEVQTARKPQPLEVAPSASKVQPKADVQIARKPEPSVKIPKPEPSKTTGEIHSARKQEPPGEVQTARKLQPVEVAPSASKLQSTGDVQTARKPESFVEFLKPELPETTDEIRSARKQEPAGKIQTARKSQSVEGIRHAMKPEPPVEEEDEDDLKNAFPSDPPPKKDTSKQMEEEFFSKKFELNALPEKQPARKKMTEQLGDVLFFLGGVTLVGLIVFFFWVVFYGTH